jgi:drug/metabolite transporter (DMT)-like permease
VLFASSVTYLIPVVAVIIGLSFNEHINIYQIGSMAIVLTGVFVANVLGKKNLRE